jgi:hypothetical protein
MITAMNDYPTLTEEDILKSNVWWAEVKERKIFDASIMTSKWHPIANSLNDYTFMNPKEEQAMTIPNGMNASTVLFLINDKIKGIHVSYDEGGRNKESIKKTTLTPICLNNHMDHLKLESKLEKN